MCDNFAGRLPFGCLGSGSASIYCRKINKYRRCLKAYLDVLVITIEKLTFLLVVTQKGHGAAELSLF